MYIAQDRVGSLLFLKILVLTVARVGIALQPRRMMAQRLQKKENTLLITICVPYSCILVPVNAKNVALPAVLIS